ncbi:MAG: DUF4214 domain-containing protein, partial [Gammaproteobacteria bacterium SHHR-1]
MMKIMYLRVLFWLLLGACSTVFAQPAGEVVWLSGQPLINEKPAQTGQLVAQGDSLKAPVGAYLYIKTAEGSLLILRPESNARLERFHLGRDGEQSGVDYWVGVLNNGAAKAEVLADFTESPENISLVATTIAEGIWLL